MLVKIIQKLSEILSKQKSIEIHTNKLLTESEYSELKSILSDSILKSVVDPSISQGFKIIFDNKELDFTLDSDSQDLKNYLLDNLSNSRDLVEELKEKIEEYKGEIKMTEFGTVLSVKDGIVFIEGLQNCKNNELLELENKELALALNLEKNGVGAIVLGPFHHIKTGDKAKRTNRILSIPVSDHLLGRVLSPLVEPLDGKSIEKSEIYYPIEKVAPGVMKREPINTPLLTGITSIDALVPIGRGQRELILGDRQTGKTTIAIDTIINQKGKDVICIYVAIGQKTSKVSRLIETLKAKGALDYTIIVSANASDSAALQYLAPYSATAIAEYFLDKGKDVLIVYDDLSKHAVAYRELSLILRRPPGREAYPGDVFYLHSRLLERSCKLNKENGGGSITALPIIETQAGDISAYIPTNVISITDGQIFLETDLFYKGVRPAINVGLSVSRVGSAAQTKQMKKVAGKLKLTLAQFRELEAFAQFSSDLDQKTKEQIERGYRITEILKQTNNNPLSILEQVLSIFAAVNGFLDPIPLEDISLKKSEFVKHILTTTTDLKDRLINGEWDEKIEEQLKQVFTEYLR